MIAFATRPSSYREPVSYILKDGRPTYSSTRNLLDLPPHHVARLMEATATANPRVERKAYHAMLAASVHDTVPLDQWLYIIERVLDHLQLAHHQALVARHDDGGTDHVHILVNRIDTSGRVWEGRHDWFLLQEILRQLEVELDLTRVEPSPRFAAMLAARSRSLP